MTISITSSAFEARGVIPIRHTCDGEDLSPPLAWSETPGGTKSIALISEDPDAPGRTWTHWVMYELPPDVRELPEGVPPDETVLGGAHQGTNDFGRLGYGGPCPPPNGPHRYSFTVYALGVKLDLAPGASKDELLAAMQGHVLGGGQLVGLYRRGGSRRP
jgi:Raf kinase inhibitor-like YbhB/YbcL family protein